MDKRTVEAECERLGCDLPERIEDPSAEVIRVIECEDSYKLVVAEWDEAIGSDSGGSYILNTGHRFYRVYPSKLDQ